MKYQMYAIRDNKQESHFAFQLPMTESNDASAVRNFEHAVMTSGSVISSHAGDFELYRIGSYDSENGFLTPDTPTFICNGNAFKKSVKTSTKKKVE